MPRSVPVPLQGVAASVVCDLGRAMEIHARQVSDVVQDRCGGLQTLGAPCNKNQKRVEV